MTKIQQAHDLSEQWHIKNPTLLNGEFGFETDTHRIKVGNGVDEWNNLQYVTDKDWNVTDINSSKYIANKPFECIEVFRANDITIGSNSCDYFSINTRFDGNKTYKLTIGDNSVYMYSYNVTSNGDYLGYVCMGLCDETLACINVEDYDPLHSYGMFGICYEEDWKDILIYTVGGIVNQNIKIDEIKRINKEYVEQGQHTYLGGNIIHYGDEITTIDGYNGIIAGHNVYSYGNNKCLYGKDIKTMSPDNVLSGINIITSAPNAVAFGLDINASMSVAVGRNISTIYGSTAYGLNINCSGFFAGGSNINCGYGAIAIGNGINTAGASMIIGNSINAKASAYKIFAFGNNISLNSYSVAFGDGIYAGVNTYAFGSIIKANNSYSCLYLGDWITTKETVNIYGSVAIGLGLNVNSNNQTILGKYNLPDDEDIYAFILGDGANSSSKRNIFTVDHNGSAYFAGVVSINSSASFTNNNDLVTKIYVDNAVNNVTVDTSTLVSLSDFNNYSNNVTNDFANRVTVSNFNNYTNNMSNTVANLVTVSNFNTYSNGMNNTVANLVTVSNFNNYSNTMNNTVANLATYSFVNDAINNVSIDNFDSGDIFSRFSLVG